LKHKKNNVSGFTLIEAMTVVLIIGILTAVIGTNFIQSSKKRAMEAELLNNMRNLQIMLETYRVDWEIYPENIGQLSIESSQKNYNKKCTNPYTRQNGPVGASIWAIDFKKLPAEPVLLYKGRVGYQRVSTTKYYLYGYDDDAVFLRRRGTVYTITNGEKEK